MKGPKQKTLIVKVGDLYVRDHPERFQGDYTLTAAVERAAMFYVEDVPLLVAHSLTKALGIEAEVLDTADLEERRKRS